MTADDQSRIPEPTGRALRTLLADADGAIAVPGGGTPLEALCAVQAGFKSFYVSGYATASWRHGIPDIGLTGLAEIAEAVGAITSVIDAPVFVDADTGYGDIANVMRTVRTLERHGAAAIQIEDQVFPKRCGHMDGKQVVPTNDMVRKIRAATRGRLSAETIIIARTDARAPLGLAEAVDRANRYGDAGADLIFIDAPETEQELEVIGAKVAAPLIVNMTETGKTPILPLSRLSELGFAVVIYPTSALRLAAGVVNTMFRQLRENGTTDDWQSQMMALDDLNSLLGLDDARHLEAGLEI